MNEFDEMEQMFADSMIVEPVNKIEEEELEIQTDEDVEAVLGVVEVEPVFEEPEPVNAVAPKVFYGSKGKEIEDEAFREKLKSQFDSSIYDLEWLDDFLVYVSNLEDKKKRDFILKVSNENLRNNPRKQYEFLMRHTFPFIAGRMEVVLAKMSKDMSQTIGSWTAEITKPLHATIKYNNDLIRAIQDAEGGSLENIKAEGVNSVKKLELALDKLIEREKEISNGHVSKVQSEILIIRTQVSEWRSACESALKEAEAKVLKARSKQIDDVLGSSIDKAVEDFTERTGIKKESPLKTFLFHAGSCFVGIWFFYVVAKHFPGIVI